MTTSVKSKKITPNHPTKDAGFGIYVHWPFCAAKCPYCDFNSHVRHRPVDQARFLEAFKSEIAHFASRTPDRRVTSIFFGGGTPSLMEPATLAGILDAIHWHWAVEPDAEISMEANPQSVEAERFKAYRKAGVNRLSLGVQALNDPELKFLGRLHNVEEALNAIKLARETFPRLSFDLIYARPNQSVLAWKEELKQALDYAVDHLSLYQLTIEPDTTFWSLREAGKLVVPSADEAAELYEVTQEICEDAGLPAYETSNHAVPGAESQHNLVYWHYGEYVGIGPGAHGRLVGDNGTSRFATATERNPERWLSLVESHQHGTITDDELSLEEQGDEFLVMGLRLHEGIDLSRYEALSGRRIDPRRVEDLLTHNMIERLAPISPGSNSENRLRASKEGAMVLDAVVADLAS
ncbi:MAG: radical SAM family heme chaperone HemW [Hyphomicrobiales bacterium]